MKRETRLDPVREKRPDPGGAAVPRLIGRRAQRDQQRQAAPQHRCQLLQPEFDIQRLGAEPGEPGAQPPEHVRPGNPCGAARLPEGQQDLAVRAKQTQRRRAVWRLNGLPPRLSRNTPYCRLVSHV